MNLNHWGLMKLPSKRAGKWKTGHFVDCQPVGLLMQAILPSKVGILAESSTRNQKNIIFFAQLISYLFCLIIILGLACWLISAKMNQQFFCLLWNLIANSNVILFLFCKLSCRGRGFKSTCIHSEIGLLQFSKYMLWARANLKFRLHHLY